ncbi:MAG: hypothetical protein WCO04_12040 [Pseudomonadota bacterium]
MKNKEDNLQELANAVLESIEAGGDYNDEYEKGFCGFVGYSIPSLRYRFESYVEDMRDHSEPDEQDWADLFGEIDQGRYSTLIAQPSLVTIEDLRAWINTNEERAYQCFCGAAGISLTSDDDGPVVVIGTMGENGETQVFLVSNSLEEAEKTWAEGWI